MIYIYRERECEGGTGRMDRVWQGRRGIWGKEDSKTGAGGKQKNKQIDKKNKIK